MSTERGIARDKADFRLLACDLDGTLLHQGKLTNHAVDAINAVHATGCRVAISTGRAYAMLPRLIRSLPSVDAFINSNGASITANGNRLSADPINNEIAGAVLRFMLEHGAVVNAFFDRTALLDRRILKATKYSEYVSDGGELGILLAMLPHFSSVKRILRHIAKTNAVVEKVGGIFPSAADAAPVLDVLQKRADITAVTTTENDVEVTAKGVNKGRALFALSEFYGIPKEQILVCGDSGNDVSMRAACGFFVAPDTASADVLAVADTVTKSAANGGIAEWLLNQFGGNK